MIHVKMITRATMSPTNKRPKPMTTPAVRDDEKKVDAKKLKERMPKPLSELVTEISKAEFKPTQKYITLEICCNDEDDEDVEVPYVRYKFRNF